MKQKKMKKDENIDTFEMIALTTQITKQFNSLPKEELAQCRAIIDNAAAKATWKYNSQKIDHEKMQIEIKSFLNEMTASICKVFHISPDRKQIDAAFANFKSWVTEFLPDAIGALLPLVEHALRGLKYIKILKIGKLAMKGSTVGRIVTILGELIVLFVRAYAAIPSFRCGKTA